MNFDLVLGCSQLQGENKDSGVMQSIIIILITIGIVIMVTNIIREIWFIKNSRDVLSSGASFDNAFEFISLALLIFFLIGYILVVVLGEPDIVIAGILSGGSIFVAIVLTLMFRLVTTVKKNSLDIAETLISVIDARDPNLQGHSRHVQNLTMLIYEYIPPTKKKNINAISLEYAALMHDIGKLGIPESVLNKPAKLDDHEWELMKQHPRYGVEILKPLNSFKEINLWIEYHHERLDGKGYYGIAGKDIPYAARIISVADTYSAITMKRSYKPPKTHEEAIAIMKDVVGSQLDAEIVEVFCGIPKEKVIACTPETVETISI